MASPNKVSDLEEWLTILSALKNKPLDEVFMFLLHYKVCFLFFYLSLSLHHSFKSQYLRSQRFAEALLMELDDLDGLDHTGTLILHNLQLFSQIEKKAKGGGGGGGKPDLDSPPGWNIEKFKRKRHLCPCDNKCQLKVGFLFFYIFIFLFF